MIRLFKEQITHTHTHTHSRMIAQQRTEQREKEGWNCTVRLKVASGLPTGDFLEEVA